MISNSLEAKSINVVMRRGDALCPAGVTFIKILQAAFTLVDPKSTK